MKLRYSIPHKVTIRMVGCMMVAACSCKQWTQQTDPHKFDNGPGQWLSGFFSSTPTGDLIEASHKHATDHVLEAHDLTRKAAA